jgi:hypothetical protein
LKTSEPGINLPVTRLKSDRNWLFGLKKNNKFCSYAVKKVLQFCSFAVLQFNGRLFGIIVS